MLSSQRGASVNAPGEVSLRITPLALVGTHDARDEDHEHHESWKVVKAVLEKVSSDASVVSRQAVVVTACKCCGRKATIGQL
jgi:hypothetical protein